MENLMAFQYEDNKVRTVTVDGEPWWVLRDVCDALGLSTPTRVADRLDDDEVSLTHIIDSLGREQSTTIISESGLYAVIMRSDKPEAKKFKRWVTHEVLPAIRKTGAYALPQDCGAGYTATQRLGEVVELAKLTVRLMKDRRSRPDEIARAVGMQLEQFGIPVPAGFYPSDALAAVGAAPSESVSRFLEDFGDVENVAVREVYEAYLGYCGRSGIAPIGNIHSFGREVTAQTGAVSKAARRNREIVRVYAR